MSQPSVAAIVLNYNGKDLTLETLRSLEGMTYPNLDIYCVDNGSTDGSYEAIEGIHQQVHQIRTVENRGVAGGLNLGIRTVMERGGYDYILLLNNDIEVDAEMLTEMVTVAETSPSIGCVGPKSYYYWDRNRIWAAGGILRFRESVTRERGMNELDCGQYDQDEEVDYINGCALLVRARIFDEIGLFDPLFHLAVEDADWCMRMKSRGYRCFYAHRAKLWHMVSMSTGVYKPARTFQTGRSTAIFVRRYANPVRWLSFLFFISIALPAAFLRELPRGNHQAAVAKFRGVVEGLRVPMSEPPQLES